MRKPEQAPEPSIEEILASIRRIIADDAPQAAAVAEDIGEVRLQAYAGERRIRAVETAPRATERGGEDEVLELTEDFMLAEEAPAMELREPAEPEEITSNGAYEGRFSAQSYDPYDDQAAARAAEPVRAPTPVAEEEPALSPSKGLASVMAEVQRFTGFGKSAEPKPVPVPAPSEPGPEPSAPIGDDGPVSTWGQPNFDSLTPDSAPRPAPSRWSARSKANDDAAKGNEALAAARSARTAQQPARENAPRKPAFGSRDSWSEGVQMPVPQEGPAMPFGAEESADAPPLPSLGPSAAMPQKPAMPGGDAQGDTRSLPSGLHLRAEQLAAQAVADFASDRLSALTGKPVVADILKGDQPLMEEITSTLADALSKTGESEEFEDAPPLEDFADDGFATDLSALMRGEARAPATPENLTPQPFGVDGGFVAAQRGASPPQSAPIMTDQDTPDLPREEVDYFASAPGADLPENPLAYGSTGSLEPPVMQQMSTPPARMTARSAPGLGGAMGLERLQPGAGGKTLEDTVREMLKPLLVQWLNENMPRIINDAMREEMATSGLMPRLDNERR